MSETFEEWFNPFDETLGQSSKYEAIKSTWNHQQKKIDELRKLTLDNQARYNGALAEIKDLEKQVAILKEAVEGYSQLEDGKYYGPSDIYENLGEAAKTALKQIEEME